MKDNANMTKGKAFMVPFVLMVIMGLVLFVPAGSLKFWEGWVFLLEISILTFFIAAYFMKRNPELLARRMQHGEKQTTIKTPVILKLYFLGYIIPGIDFHFHWSMVPAWAIIVSNIIVTASYIFIIYVFKENSFASTVVQVEKWQHIITTGPYAIVRHPMYLGLLLMSLFTPLALGSYWAIIPMLLFIPLIIIRIINEEKVLLCELHGYKDYCLKTRYRLIPLIW